VWIERIELRVVRVRLAEPFETSFGTSQEELKLLVRLDAEGVTGWGECPAQAFPGYSYETAWTALWISERFLAPACVGKSFDSAEALQKAFSPVRGHPMAKAGIEFALWDALGRQKGRSVSVLIGGTQHAVEAGISLGLQRSDELLIEKTGKAFGRGYRRVKTKIKPGRDLQMLQALRKAFPDRPLMVDANAAYTLHDAPLLARFDELNLTMIEQPLHHGDLLDHAELAKKIRTPICLDESVTDRNAARQALASGACAIINIKAARVGGLAEAIAVHDEAVKRNAPVWCGGLLETGIGRALNVALASLPGFTLPGDLSETARYWPEEDDLFQPAFRLNSGGTLSVPQTPGLGVTPVLTRIEGSTIARAEVRAGSPT